jgi:hypothetical protein
MPREEPRAEATLTIATLIGAISLARAVGDDPYPVKFWIRSKHK